MAKIWHRCAWHALSLPLSSWPSPYAPLGGLCLTGAGVGRRCRTRGAARAGRWRCRTSPRVASRQLRRSRSLWPRRCLGHCCGQGRRDTQGSNPSQFLICLGTTIPQIRVLPSAVIAHCDGSEAMVSRLLTRGVSPRPRPVAFSAATESRGSCLVEPRTLPTHTPADPMGYQQVLIRVTGLWTATIRMMQSTCCGMPPSLRHRSRVLPHRGSTPTTPPPPPTFRAY
jgi:hypothetical protein